VEPSCTRKDISSPSDDEFRRHRVEDHTSFRSSLICAAQRKVLLLYRIDVRSASLFFFSSDSRAELEIGVRSAIAHRNVLSRTTGSQFLSLLSAVAAAAAAAAAAAEAAATYAAPAAFHLVLAELFLGAHASSNPLAELPRLHPGDLAAAGLADVEAAAAATDSVAAAEHLVVAVRGLQEAELRAGLGGAGHRRDGGGRGRRRRRGRWRRRRRRRR
jgi:hypothetical protein